MAQDDYPYPEDEFDVLGRERSPQAVHRAPRPWWRVWGPLIAVVILAPLLAIAVVKLATSDGGSPATEPTPAVTATEDATDGAAPTDGAASAEPSADASTEPSSEPTQEESQAPPLDQAVAVSVLNGARVQGLAGSVQEQLAAAGWTSVSSGNYQSAEPTVSTVFYRDADLADEAQAIAQALGIGPVTELASVESITVVLRSDFTG